MNHALNPSGAAHNPSLPPGPGPLLGLIVAASYSYAGEGEAGFCGCDCARLGVAVRASVKPHSNSKSRLVMRANAIQASLLSCQIGTGYIDADVDHLPTVSPEESGFR